MDSARDGQDLRRPRRSRLRRALAIAVRALACLGALVLLVGVTALLVVTRTRAGHEKLRAALEARVNDRLAGRLSIGGLDGDITRDIVLRDVVVFDVVGREAVRVARLGVTWRPLALLHRTVAITRLALEGVEVDARPLADGRPNLAALARPSAPKTNAGPSSFTIDLAAAEVTAHGSFRDAGGKTIEGRAHLLGSARLAKGLVERATLSGLTVDLALPAVAHLDAHGQAHQRDGGALQIDGVDLHAATTGDELRRALPSTDVVGPLDLAAHVDGDPAGRLAATLRLAPSRGRVEVEGEVEGAATRGAAGVAWQGAVRIADLDPALWRGAPHGTVTARVTGRGTDARGEVVIEELHAAVDHARATLTGRSDLAGNGSVALHVESADLARVHELGARLGYAPGGALRADLRAHRRAGLVDADVTATGDHFAVASVRARSLSLEAHLRELRDLADLSRLRVDVRGSGSDVHVGRSAARRVGLDLHARGLAGRGTLHARGVLAAGHRLDQVGLVASSSGHDAAVGVELSGPDLRASLGAHSDFQLEGGRLTALHGRLERAVLRTKRSRYALAAPAAFAVDRRGATLGEVRIDGPAGHLAVSGAWARTGAIAARLAAHGVRVEELVAITQPEKAQGMSPMTVQATVDVRGTLAQPDVTAALSGEIRGSGQKLYRVGIATWPGSIQKVLVDHGKVMFAISLHWARGRAAITLHAGDQKKASLEVTAAVPLPPVPDGAIAARLTLLNLPSEMLAAARPVLFDWTGFYDADLLASGTVRDPRVALVVRGRDLTSDTFDHLTAELALKLVGDRLQVALDSSLRGARLVRGQVNVALAARPGRLLLGTARGPLDGALDGDLWVDGYDLARLHGIAFDADVRGVLRGHARIGGHLSDPHATADLATTGLTVDRVAIPRAIAHAAWDGRQLTADALLDEQGGGTLRASATLPADASAPMALHATARALDVGFVSALSRGRMSDVHGILDLTADADGPRSAPSLRGEAHLARGAFVLAADARRYEDVSLDLVARPGRLELGRLHAASDGGHLDAHGELRLDHLRPLTLDGSIAASRFGVALPASGVATLDGTLHVDGRATDRGFAGRLLVSDGAVRLPKLPQSARPQRTGRLEDVVFADEQARRDDARKVGAGAAIELTVEVPGPFRLRGPEVDTALAGDLLLRVRGSSVALGGTVASRSGWIDVLGHRYVIDRVRLTFDGGDQLDPALDVRVTRRVAGAVLVVGVTGTAQQPRLSVASDPPIYDEAQILARILSEDPAAPPSEASLDRRVVGAISGVIVRTLEDQLAPGLPIDLARRDVDKVDYTIRY